MTGHDDVTIRRMNAADEGEAWACADLMASTEPWLTLRRTRDDTFRGLVNPFSEPYVAVTTDDGEIVGLVNIMVNVPIIMKGYIAALVVRPDHRGRGIGSMLVEFAEQRILRDSPNVFICCSSFNEDARRLYERLGYQKIGEFRDLVVPGSSEILLRKTTGPWSTFARVR
jgi:ribosomal protein S18 acetylase RimI-like enzyme